MAYQDVAILLPSLGLDDLPTDLPEAKSAGLLNAFAVGWHPALLSSVRCLPAEYSAEDPPAPIAGRVVLLPPASEEKLPEGWIESAQAEGISLIAGCTSREEWLAALGGLPDLPAIPNQALIADFFALGTCRLLVELLSKRMHHFSGLDEGRLQREAIAAADAAVADDHEATRAHLQSCFEVLTEMRERFYPVDCYLLDLCLLTSRTADEHFDAVIASPKPINVLAAGEDWLAISAEKPELVERVRSALDAGRLDLLGGEFRERPTPILPFSSTLAEYGRGLATFQSLFGRAPTTWGRRRYGFSTLVPLLAHRSGSRGALHVALDDGLYPDIEQSKIRWEGCDGSVVDATTRIPLAADSAVSMLRFPTRMAEAMQQDQTAATIFARWPEVKSPWWSDFERIFEFGGSLGKFVTFRDYFEQADDPGRLSRFEEREYLSPFLIQAVAAEEPDPISRFVRHFERRAIFDAASFLAALTDILREQPVALEERRALEESVERSGPDLVEGATIAFDEFPLRLDLNSSAERLGGIILHGAGAQPGHLVLNSLSFDRKVTVAIPAESSEHPPRTAVVDLPACGFAWIPVKPPEPKRPTAQQSSMVEGTVIRNEFIEVHINDETGGIGRIKEYGRKPNRLSQQLAFRFPRERRQSSGPVDEDAYEERTFYSQMRCSSVELTASGPSFAEIATAGTLVDPETGERIAGFRQWVRLWRGRRIIEVEAEIEPDRMPEGDPWSNYFASRFAWNDSAATLTRSVLYGAHGFQLERFESPWFLEIATETQRTTILNGGRPFHRKTGPRMVDSLLIVAGESQRRFKFGIAIDADYPMQPAAEMLHPPTVISAPGPPAGARSGWLFHVSAKNVQLVQILPLMQPPEPASDAERDPWETPENLPAGFGFTLRLVETEGRHRPVQVHCFRTPTHARQRDFRGKTISALKIVDDAVLIEMTGFEIADIELRFGELPAEPAGDMNHD